MNLEKIKSRVNMVEKHTIRSWRHGFEQWYVIDFHSLVHSLGRRVREKERKRDPFPRKLSPFLPRTTVTLKARNIVTRTGFHCDIDVNAFRNREDGYVSGKMVARAAFATNRCETCTLVHDSLKFSKFPVRPPVCSCCFATKSRVGMC